MRRCAGYDVDGIEGDIGSIGRFCKPGKWSRGFRCRIGDDVSHRFGRIEVGVTHGDNLDIVKVPPEFDVTSGMAHSHAACAD